MGLYLRFGRVRVSGWGYCYCPISPLAPPSVVPTTVLEPPEWSPATTNSHRTGGGADCVRSPPALPPSTRPTQASRPQPRRRADARRLTPFSLERGSGQWGVEVLRRGEQGWGRGGKQRLEGGASGFWVRSPPPPFALLLLLLFFCLVRRLMPPITSWQNLI